MSESTARSNPRYAIEWRPILKGKPRQAINAYIFPLGEWVIKFGLPGYAN